MSISGSLQICFRRFWTIFLLYQINSGRAVSDYSVVICVHVVCVFMCSLEGGIERVCVFLSPTTEVLNECMF